MGSAVDLALVQGWATDFAALHRRLGPCFGRAEPQR